jgi:hypothetical protein
MVDDADVTGLVGRSNCQPSAGGRDERWVTKIMETYRRLYGSHHHALAKRMIANRTSHHRSSFLFMTE